MAAPRAWTMRAATSRSTDGATPQSADATVNSPTPATNARRRPSRSVMRPHTMRKAAKTMLYALRTQERLPIDVVGKDSRIDGKATLTMVASRKARKAPKQATRSTRVGATRADGAEATGVPPPDGVVSPPAQSGRGDTPAQEAAPSHPTRVGCSRGRGRRGARHATGKEPRFRPCPGPALRFTPPCRAGFRAVAQLGSALDWGSRGRRFKSCQPDRVNLQVRGGFRCNSGPPLMCSWGPYPFAYPFGAVRCPCRGAAGSLGAWGRMTAGT